MATKMRQKKYLHQELVSENYYQNQNNTRDKKQQKKANTPRNNGNSRMPPSHPPPTSNRTTGLNQINLHLDTNVQSTPTTSSSIASANRALIIDDEKNENDDIAFCFLTLSILFLVCSVVAIAITFIFPFWFRLTMAANPNSTYLNMTNTNNNLTLLAYPTNGTTSVIVYFDIGVWEVKMNQEIEMVDMQQKFQNPYPQSMLWLNSDENFLERFVKFIELKMSNLFIVQTLELLHLIFAFLAFTFIAFTVCLSSNNSKSLCWYFVCFVLSMVTFSSGIVVVILIIFWQTAGSPSFKDESGRQVLMKKEFGWTFWTSVGINSVILLAATLIILHILVESFIYYFRSKKIIKHNKQVREKLNQASNKLSTFHTANGIIVANGNIPNDVYQPNNLRLAHFPPPHLLQHTPTTQFPPPPPIVPFAHSKSSKEAGTQFNNKTASSADEQTEDEHQEQFTSPSYIFYTGHGQYRKQSINLDEINQEKSKAHNSHHHQNYEITHRDLLKKHHQNTTLNSNNLAINNEHEHPYSNVTDATHLNANDLKRYLNYR